MKGVGGSARVTERTRYVRRGSTTSFSTEQAAIAYAVAGGSPGLAAQTAAKLADDRPDLVQSGEYASTYGFVMNGGTSGNALSVYEAQAKEFTGFWAGTQDLDTALGNATEAMTELLK